MQYASLDVADRVSGGQRRFVPVQKIVQLLRQAGVSRVTADEPLAHHTTWRIGGPADVFVYPKSKDELQKAMHILYQEGIPWRAIGRGSNLLVRDAGIRGAVIKLGDGLDHVTIDGVQVTAGGGYSFVGLAGKTAKAGLTGLEFGVGIPGTVGGAVYMNAGAHGSDVSRTLVSAEVMLETGEWEIMTAEDLKFRYRTSVLQEDKPGIVTEATFRLTPGNAEEIMANVRAYKQRRSRTQPIQYPCAGSVFRNPPGDYAGNLIESAGLKGYRIGDAEVSELHANFIINRGEATAEDVLALISHIQQVVKDKFGVELQTEVQVAGEG